MSLDLQFRKHILWFICFACACVALADLAISNPLALIHNQPPVQKTRGTKAANTAHDLSPKEEILIGWPFKQVVNISVEQPEYKPSPFNIRRTSIPEILKAISPPVLFAPTVPGYTVHPDSDPIAGKLHVTYDDNSTSDIVYFDIGVNSLVYLLDGRLYQRGSRYQNSLDMKIFHKYTYGYYVAVMDESSALSALLRKRSETSVEGPFLKPE